MKPDNRLILRRAQLISWCFTSGIVAGLAGLLYAIVRLFV